jgi:hypothetical protein
MPLNESLLVTTLEVAEWFRILKRRVGLSIPISTEFAYGFGKYEIAPGAPVWQQKWPIITLPTVSIKLQDDHRCRCRLGANGAVASCSLKADSSYHSALVNNGATGASDWSFFSPESGNVWSISKRDNAVAVFEKRVTSSSPEPNGLVAVSIQPKFPPLLKVVKTVYLDSLFSPDPVACTDPAPCDGGDFFDKLSKLSPRSSMQRSFSINHQWEHSRQARCTSSKILWWLSRSCKARAPRLSSGWVTTVAWHHKRRRL